MAGLAPNPSKKQGRPNGHEGHSFLKSASSIPLLTLTFLSLSSLFPFPLSFISLDKVDHEKWQEEEADSIGPSRSRTGNLAQQLSVITEMAVYISVRKRVHTGFPLRTDSTAVNSFRGLV